MQLDIVETQEPLDREGDRAGDVTASNSLLCPPAVVLRKRTDIDHAKPRLVKTPPQLGRRHLVPERHSTSRLCRVGLTCTSSHLTYDLAGGSDWWKRKTLSGS